MKMATMEPMKPGTFDGQRDDLKVIAWLLKLDVSFTSFELPMCSYS